MLDQSMFISDLSKLSSISTKKLLEYSKNRPITDVLEMPLSISPNNNQLYKLTTLKNLINNYNILNGLLVDIKSRLPEAKIIKNYFFNALRLKKDREILAVALFNENGQLVKLKRISNGDLNVSLVPKRVIVSEVLKNKAKQLLIVHNHPSGDPSPSKEDIYVTKAIANICKTLDIKFLDHIIVGDGFVSLKENYEELFDYDAATNNGLSNNLTNICNAHIFKFISNISSLLQVNNSVLEEFLVKPGKYEETIKRCCNFLGGEMSMIEDFTNIIKLKKIDRVKNLASFVGNYKTIRNSKENVLITDKNSAFDFFKNKLNVHEKILVVAYLNTKNSLIAWNVYYNDINFQEIVKDAVLNHTNAIILGTNISSDLLSEEVSIISQKFVNVLDPLYIKVLDLINYDRNIDHFESAKANNWLAYCYKEDVKVKNLFVNKVCNQLEEDWEPEY